MPINLNEVGQGRTHPDPTAAYDAAHGTYHDRVPDMPEDDRLPSGQMPKGPDPSPFVLGPMTSGGR